MERAKAEVELCDRFLSAIDGHANPVAVAISRVATFADFDVEYGLTSAAVVNRAIHAVGAAGDLAPAKPKRKWVRRKFADLGKPRRRGT